MICSYYYIAFIEDMTTRETLLYDKIIYKYFKDGSGEKNGSLGFTLKKWMKQETIF